MTLYNQIGEFGLNDLLTKRLTTPGGSNAPAVAPEVFPVLALESDRPEWGYIKGELPFSSAAVVSNPGAGAHAAFCLNNAVGGQNLIVVKQIYVSALCRVGVGFPETTAGLGFGISRDSRFSARSAATIIVGNSLTAGLPSRAAFLKADEYQEQPWILAPGQALTFFAAADNVAINAHVLWTERKAQPGELP